MWRRFVSSSLAIVTGLATVSVAQEDYSQWSFKKTITVNTTSTGINVSQNVAKYPLLVRLGAAEATVFAQAGTNGASLRFTKADGSTRLPHSIDHWDPVGQSAAIWVLADTVYGNNAQGVNMRMFWGKVGAPDSSKPGAVFDTANGFRAVWHLNETASPALDATPLGTDAVWMNSPTSAAGNIGNAINIANPNGTSSADGKYLRAAYNAVNENFRTNSVDGLTLSAWVNRTSNNGQGNQGIAGRWNWSGGERRQSILEANATSWQFAVSPTGLGNNEVTVGDVPVVNGEWAHVVATYRNGSQTLYVNGVADTTLTMAVTGLDSVWAAAPFLIGRMETNGCCLQGIDALIDEVRLSDTTRSAAWIALDYQTQVPASNAVMLGATVNQAPTGAPITNLHFGNDTLNALLNTPFTITATYNGGPIDSFKVISGTLPTGLTLNKTTGVISGTATAAAAAANVVVRGWAGTEDSAQVTLRVAAVQGLSNLRYVSTNAGTRDTLRLELTVAANVTPTITGTPTRYSINGSIPAGLSFDSTTGRIHGTPTALQSGLNRTVTATGPFNTTTRDIRIIVTLGPPTATYHPRDTLTATVGASLTAAPITGGRALTKWTAVTALPAGLRLDTLNGAISGVPTAAAAAANYTIRGTSATDTLNKVIRLTVSAATADGDYKTAWSGHRRIKLNTSASGANVAGTVTNVPVLVRFDSTQADVFTNGGTNGASLRFTKTDATTRLPHEIDTWDAAARKGAVWVLVDTVKGNTAAQEIWLHYGNASASPVSNAHAVFSEANGFVSVFHLGGGNNVSPRHNAVSGRNPAYPFNLPATHASHAGIIGTADSLGGNGAGAASQHFSFGPIPAGTFTNTQGTLSLWLKPSTPFNAYASHAISLGSGTPNNNFWVGRFGGETVASIAGSSGDATSEGDRFVGPNDAASGWAQGEWQLVHFSLDNTEVNVYKNGGLIGSASNQKLPDGVRSSAYIGRALWSADALLAGLYDEVRVANKARSDSWVKLEYENQRAAQTLVSIDTLTFPGTGIAQASLLQDQLSFSPTNGGVMFNIRTDKTANARLEVIDMRGRAVWSRSLKTTSGLNQVLWSGRSEQGAGTGVYFVRMLLLDENNVPTHRLERKLPLTR